MYGMYAFQSRQKRTQLTKSVQFWGGDFTRKISDEKLLTALLINGSVGKTATALGVTRSGIYKRLQDTEFRKQFDTLQGVMLSTASVAMADGLADAVGTLLDIIRDDLNAASVRVSAADSLLRHCCRYLETANILRRLDVLEGKK